MNTTTAAHIDRSERNVGIDIGKCMLDVCIFEPDVYVQYPNTPEGIRELLKKLSRYKLNRILVEATGGYNAAWWKPVPKRNYPSPLCNPHRFANLLKRKASVPKRIK